MKIDLNKIVSALILIVGYCFFFLNIANNIAFATIAILGTFLLWMIWNKIAETLDLNAFFTMLAGSGIIVAISILAIYGIEPIGTRKGTSIYFHSYGIAISLGILFVTLIPYLVFNIKFKLPKPFNVTFVSGFKNKNQSSSKNTQDKYVVGDGDWEIASDQDVKSGNYNIE